MEVAGRGGPGESSEDESKRRAALAIRGAGAGPEQRGAQRRARCAGAGPLSVGDRLPGRGWGGLSSGKAIVPVWIWGEKGLY